MRTRINLCPMWRALVAALLLTPVCMRGYGQHMSDRAVNMVRSLYLQTHDTTAGRVRAGTRNMLLQAGLQMEDGCELAVQRLMSPQSTESLAWARANLSDPLVRTTTGVLAYTILNLGNESVRLDGQSIQIVDGQLAELRLGLARLLSEPPTSSSRCELTPEWARMVDSALRGNLDEDGLAQMKECLERQWFTSETTLPLARSCWPATAIAYLNQTDDVDLVARLWAAHDGASRNIVFEMGRHANESSTIFAFVRDMARHVAYDAPSDEHNEWRLRKTAVWFLAVHYHDPKVRDMVNALVLRNPGNLQEFQEMLVWEYVKPFIEGRRKSIEADVAGRRAVKRRYTNCIRLLELADQAQGGK